MRTACIGGRARGSWELLLAAPSVPSATVTPASGTSTTGRCRRPRGGYFRKLRSTALSTLMARGMYPLAVSHAI